MDHGGGMMGMMGGWMLLWGLVGLAVLVLAVLTSIWVGRRLTPGRRDEMAGSPGRRGEGSNALEVLRRRYAAGELDREQYLRMQRDLSGE